MWLAPRAAGLRRFINFIEESVSSTRPIRQSGARHAHMRLAKRKRTPVPTIGSESKFSPSKETIDSGREIDGAPAQYLILPTEAVIPRQQSDDLLRWRGAQNSQAKPAALHCRPPAQKKAPRGRVGAELVLRWHPLGDKPA